MDRSLSFQKRICGPYHAHQTSFWFGILPNQEGGGLDPVGGWDPRGLKKKPARPQAACLLLRGAAGRSSAACWRCPRTGWPRCRSPSTAARWARPSSPWRWTRLGCAPRQPDPLLGSPDLFGGRNGTSTTSGHKNDAKKLQPTEIRAPPQGVSRQNGLGGGCPS